MVALVACQGQPSPAPGAVTEAKPLPPAPRVAPARLDPHDPNIVLVLMDDFSLDLLQTMRNAERMRETGASYPQSYVVDSLCCVSRASIFTGQYPHQTGVLTNTANTPNPVGPIGGWEAFETYGNTERSVNVRLQKAGYTTGFIGKYLNEYSYVPGGEVPDPPPGWSEWEVIFGSAYDGWEFESTYVEDGLVHVREHPAPPASASDARQGQRVRRHGHRRARAGVHPRAPGRPGAVLPRGGVVRPALPRRTRGRTTGATPASRRRSRTAPAPATAGWWRAPRWTSTTCAASATRSPTTLRAGRTARRPRPGARTRPA